MSAEGADIFPKWFNTIRYAVAIGAMAGGAYAAVILTFGFTPYATDVGYMPQQPVPYSHAMHAGTLGMDCRYCHTTVEKTSHAAIPPTQTCMGCHTNIRPASPNVVNVKASHTTGEPIDWIKVHDLPDYAYFNHSAHVTRGIGCVSCHGRVDKMEVVWQDQPLSMSWCLDCHRQPEQHLRPVEEVTNMNWVPPTDQLTFGRELKEKYNINPSTDCSTCHR